MYPKPIGDLSGWNVRSIACSGKGWMVACDDTVIGCAPSPCFGELVSLRLSKVNFNESSGPGGPKLIAKSLNKARNRKLFLFRSYTCYKIQKHLNLGRKVPLIAEKEKKLSSYDILINHMFFFRLWAKTRNPLLSRSRSRPWTRHTFTCAAWVSLTASSLRVATRTRRRRRSRSTRSWIKRR